MYSRKASPAKATHHAPGVMPQRELNLSLDLLAGNGALLLLLCGAGSG